MPILIIWWLLILYWLIAVYSVSIFESFQLSLKLVAKWNLTQPTNYFYFVRHIYNLAIALGFAWIVYKIPLSYIKKYRNLIFVGALILQLLVFTAVGTTFQGSRGWLYLPALGTLQPVEFFKLAWVLFLSWWLIKKKNFLWTIDGLILFYMLLGIFGFIYLLLPDLGALLIIILVSLILFRYAGGSFRQMIISLLILGSLGILIGTRFGYIQQRFGYFLNPQVDEAGRWVWWQIEQWITAIWAWWIFGRGYGKGLQKFGYIPEAQSDFIFSAFAEEVWFLWNLVLLGLYLSLARVSLSRLKYVKDEYWRNVVVGIVALILVQAWVNMAVNVKLLPVTGLTLPFVSYGGSSLLVSLIEIVLLYKILYQYVEVGKKSSNKFTNLRFSSKSILS